MYRSLQVPQPEGLRAPGHAENPSALGGRGVKKKKNQKNESENSRTGPAGEGEPYPKGVAPDTLVGPTGSPSTRADDGVKVVCAMGALAQWYTRARRLAYIGV